MTTNREKLNQMSNEKLAEIIDDIESLGPSCDFCAYADISPEKICSKPRGEKCKDGILQWLNQESEGTMTLEEENAKLKQECKNLEEELRGCRIGIKDISIESTEICKISEKYKRVLDEIEKNIKAMNNECFYDGYECNNCDMRNGCSYYRKFKILDIINKAKEGNNNG